MHAKECYSTERLRVEIALARNAGVYNLTKRPIDTKAVEAMATMIGLELPIGRIDMVMEHLRRLAVAASVLDNAARSEQREQANIVWHL